MVQRVGTRLSSCARCWGWLRKQVIRPLLASPLVSLAKASGRQPRPRSVAGPARASQEVAPLARPRRLWAAGLQVLLGSPLCRQLLASALPLASVPEVTAMPLPLEMPRSAAKVRKTLRSAAD